MFARCFHLLGAAGRFGGRKRPEGCGDEITEPQGRCAPRRRPGPAGLSVPRARDEHLSSSPRIYRAVPKAAGVTDLGTRACRRPDVGLAARPSFAWSQPHTSLTAGTGLDGNSVTSSFSRFPSEGSLQRVEAGAVQGDKTRSLLLRPAKTPGWDGAGRFPSPRAALRPCAARQQQLSPEADTRESHGGESTSFSLPFGVRDAVSRGQFGLSGCLRGICGPAQSPLPGKPFLPRDRCSHPLGPFSPRPHG